MEPIEQTISQIITAMRKAPPDDREVLKQQLLSIAAGPDTARARELIENLKKSELLELQWDLEEILEATAPRRPEPPKKPEPPKVENPNRPLTQKDLVQVYDDPRGIMLHKSKVGNRWFLTQVDPRSGQPMTIELKAQEVDQIQAQLQGSPYWLIGSGVGSGGAGGSETGGSATGAGATGGLVTGGLVTGGPGTKPHPRR